MRVLPKAEREAMYAIYAFCRAVDDIADDQGSAPEAAAPRWTRWRADLRASTPAATRGRRPRWPTTCRRFDLEQDDFLAVIDGMEMDVDEDIRAPVPRHARPLLRPRGQRRRPPVGAHLRHGARAGRELAHHLGRALQLTNILRDLDEDAEIGRLYLPRELLDRARDRRTTTRWSVVDDPRVDLAAHVLADRALRPLPRGRPHPAAPSRRAG